MSIEKIYPGHRRKPCEYIGRNTIDKGIGHAFVIIIMVQYPNTGHFFFFS